MLLLHFGVVERNSPSSSIYLPSNRYAEAVFKKFLRKLGYLRIPSGIQLSHGMPTWQRPQPYPLK